eukprot:m.651621 g.651621  ORF g.651621 m.651621 type:complete len:56 (+) comp22678_c0_seq3:390-557(+)
MGTSHRARSNEFFISTRACVPLSKRRSQQIYIPKTEDLFFQREDLCNIASAKVVP